MNRKHIPLLLALAANLTTAAAPDSERAASPDKSYNLHHLYRPDNLHTLSSAAPKPDNMDAPPVLQPQPASVYDAATAAKTDITYTPYPSAKNIPANNGHRKILGETADGRLVLQDYYPKSDRPRTAPYILNRYGDPQILTINADSKLVWYNQDGSVYAIQHYHDGQPAGYLSYYRNGRLVAQKPRPGSDHDFYGIGGKATAGTRYYYDDGHFLALEYQYGRIGRCYNTLLCLEGESLYAPDGTPLLAWSSEQSGDIYEHHSWNSLNSTPAGQQAARRQSIDAALARRDDIKQQLQKTSDPNWHKHGRTGNDLPEPALFDTPFDTP